MGRHGLRASLLVGLAVVLIACSALVSPDRASPTPSPASSSAPADVATVEEVAPPPPDARLPHGFGERVLVDGLVQPTAIAIGPHGRLFVGEKGGRILHFDQVGSTTPTVLIDLSRQTFDFWELGLLDLALAPEFPEDPFLYVAYTHDAPIGEAAPVWNDDCPGGPGPESAGCETSGRVSRFRIAGDSVVGGEQILLEDWCGQFGSHSVGSLLFDEEGALFVSGGEGANPHFVDVGQHGAPANVCGDPEGEGGALRSQDVLTDDDPAGLNGTVIRVDPSTGEAMPDNPAVDSADANERRIVAHGLRNPFRMAIDPTTGDLWIGDVGWANWDEFNRMTVGDGIPNFGWPCYEGGAPASDEIEDYEDVLAALQPASIWPFEGTGRTRYDEAVSLEAPPLVAGGGAARFDGSPDSTATLSVPRTETEFSFAVWVSPNSWERTPQLVDGGDAWEIGFDDTLYFRLRVGGEDHFASAPAPPTVGEPHLLVATYSGARQRLYVDGQAVADNAFPGDVTLGGTAILGNRLAGLVDEASFWQRELTGAEVSDLWSAGTGQTGLGGRQPRYAAASPPICDRLYADPSSVAPPHTGYEIGSEVAAGDGCETAANALSGLVFGEDLGFGPPYSSGLFFADFTRRCIWYLPRREGELVRTPVLFMRDAAGPVDLVPTPEGTLVYVDFIGGAVHEIHRE